MYANNTKGKHKLPLNVYNVALRKSNFGDHSKSITKASKATTKKS